MLKKITVILLSLMTSWSTFAQYTNDQLRNVINTSSESQLVTECSRMLQNGYFHHADVVTDKLLEFNPESSNYHYRKGFLYLASKGDFISALPHLEKAVLSVKKNYDMYSANEKSSPYDAIYHLGVAYHMANRIDEAEAKYNEFLKLSTKKSPLVREAKLKLKQTVIARELLGSPNNNIKIKNIGKPINTSYPEYSPVISLDGSAIYFTTRRPWAEGESDAYIDTRFNLLTEDIFISFLDEDNNWTDPERMEFCKPELNEASVAVSADERRVYIYKDATGGGDIYFSDFSSAKFSIIAQDDRDGLNTPAWEPHCTVTIDGQTVYFVSDRKGGYGGRDIYRIDRTPDGGWSDPKNLGSSINTEYDEDSPYIAIDNETLYFSHNGPKSMGGFDVFVCQKDDKGKWSEPKNLGYPLNTCGDEIFYTTTLDGRKGYLSSYRADGYGEKDIYEILHNYTGLKNISALLGTIKVLEGQELPEQLGMTLVCQTCNPVKYTEHVPRLRDGNFFASLEPCQTYEVIYHYGKEKEELHRETLKTSCDQAYEEIRREILYDADKRKFIVPVDTVIEIIETPVVSFQNFEFKHFYDYNINKLSIRKGEFNEFMKNVEGQVEKGRESITINIYSSASQVPTKTFKTNEKLTKTRAENIRYDIMEYIAKNKTLKGKVNVVIVDAKVDGPAYEKDGFNMDKYRPYQYIMLKTE
jgi:hypothetical protein